MTVRTLPKKSVAGRGILVTGDREGILAITLTGRHGNLKLGRNLNE